MSVLGGPILRTVGDPIPTNGLIAEYLFSGNANDTSGNGYDGTVVGATLTTNRKGNPNKAYSFDGIDDYININAALTGLGANTVGTFSAWVKPIDATPPDHTDIISFGDQDVNEYILFRLRTTGKLWVSVNDAGSVMWTLETDSAQFTDNVWTHVALVQDGDPLLYIDGVAVSQTFSAVIDKTRWFNDLAGLDLGRIGDRNINGSGEGKYFKGSIDDIRFYDRDLSQAEITILANE